MQNVKAHLSSFSGQNWPAKRLSAGFTLIELMIVITLIGVAVGLVSLSVSPSHERLLQEEIARLQALFRVAQDSARVNGRTVVWSADSKGYQFTLLDAAAAREWQDEVLRPRQWPFEVKAVRIEAVPDGTNTATITGAPEANVTANSRMLFGREPLLQPVQLRFDLPDKIVIARLDALGNLTLVNADDVRGRTAGAVSQAR